MRPCGATPDSSGVNFVLYSEHAASVTLVIFADGKRFEFSMRRVGDVWRTYVSGAQPGDTYAYRVLSEKARGVRASAGLLLDPYAYEIVGSYRLEEDEETAHGLLGRIVTVSDYDWGDDSHQHVPMNETVIYEAHVRGTTISNESVAPETRGTFTGLASPCMLAHYKALGITTVSLMPSQAFIDENRLIRKGLKNYWGYNTVGYFAPSSRYAKAETSARTEFREMVKLLHGAGLEVIMDVVYNHTAESDETGPVLHMKGIDNLVYYQTNGQKQNKYVNYSGCGNTLNVGHRAVLNLILDSMRYWVTEMHVDGFRFDLAATLVRQSEFLESVAADPVLKGVKLIAEPWDLGPDGYRVGRFPHPWSEWNDRFRDDVRDFWLTHRKGVGALADRLAGSSALYRKDDRRPTAGINFVTAHDGFTLRDLVSYARKHNNANGENSRDGTADNHSINCGVEGETRKLDVIARRRRLARALLATLFLSQGVPMLLSGDEVWKTQSGNNNAYCQDNAITWINWTDAEPLTEFIGRLTGLRRRFPQLQNPVWLCGTENENLSRDVQWLNIHGEPMQDGDWSDATDTLTVRLAGLGTARDILLCFNRSAEATTFQLPRGIWSLELATGAAAPEKSQIKNTLVVDSESVVVLSETSEQRRESGVILHVTSLPGPYGCGDFGAEAYDFIDWLKAAKQSLWQVLPLTVTGLGNSPYMGASVFAGNELLIDIRTLLKEGLLTESEIVSPFTEADKVNVDYPKTNAWRFKCLRLAAKRFFDGAGDKTEFNRFVQRESAWLEDYALYRTIAQIEGTQAWQKWHGPYKARDAKALEEIRQSAGEAYQFWKFVQWKFDCQWQSLRRYAHDNGIRIIGDIPIYVAGESSDVWAHQSLFELDAAGNQTMLAGVPPDYFSVTGQLWGNPIYRWDEHERENFSWWTERLTRAASLYDVLRIDHFRGFAAFWSIPAGAATALEGNWVKGPGAAPFRAFMNAHPDIDFIAEDLGILTDDVTLLRNSLGFPAMRVLQFAFDGDPSNLHIPTVIEENTAYYTGTHDNDTTQGWFSSIPEGLRLDLKNKLQSMTSISERAIEIVYRSRARYAMTTVQDVLGLGSQDRMNKPGDATGAWRWRLLPGLLTPERAEWLRLVTESTGRNTIKDKSE